MRLWLDDIRPMPDDFDMHARTAEEATACLASGTVTHISLDHDLAAEHYVSTGYCSSPPANGYTVAVWIEEAVRAGRIAMPTWAVHSQNPVGAERIRQAMRSASELAPTVIAQEG